MEQQKRKRKLTQTKLNFKKKQKVINKDAPKNLAISISPIHRAATEEECFEHFCLLYAKYGTDAFSVKTLPEQKKLYSRMRTLRLKMEDFALRKNCLHDFQENIQIMRKEAMSFQTTEQLIKILKGLVKKHGCIVLHNEWLKENNYQIIANRFLNEGITFKHIAKTFKVKEKYQESCRKLQNRNRIHWTPELFKEKTKKLIADHGDIPPMKWFTHGSGRKEYLGYWRYMYEQGKTIDDVRKEHGIQRSNISRNGMHWNSFAEVCVSNWWYARGFGNQVNNKKYGEEYKNYGPHKTGIYDVCPLGSNGETIVDSEIFAFHSLSQQKQKGQCPINISEYLEKRRQKEEYNKHHNPYFVSLEYEDCMDDDILTKKFKPFIGVIEPFVFDKACDRLCTPAKWTLMDRIVERMKIVLGHMDNVFPRSEWFEKKGRFKKRQIHEWENSLGYSLGSLNNDIGKIGRETLIKILSEHGIEVQEPPCLTQAKSIQMIDILTNKVLQTFVSKTKAAEHVTKNIGGTFKSNNSNISRAALKKRTCQGYKWKYK